ncbi:MAG: DNA mismatch repair endonuclease MutL [Rickettsiales bacterium]
MSIIRVLPPTLINQIAAGEVIERPASVVKELIENSLDAKAKNIEISLEQGGKNLISISDDGKGMSKEELSLAIQRHATSKLPDNDLLNINFLGFRGEALPSIGSVSRMSITSKSTGQKDGWKITVEGGNIGDVSPASIGCATSIKIRDLFYATPARLKFLKSERSEIAQINDIVKRLAMANHHVSFILSSNGKTTLKTASNNKRINRISDIMGKNFADNSVALDYKRDNIRLTGFASLPTFNKGTSSEQYLFINGRAVRDRLLLGAIKGAYQGVLAHDRHPVVVLFIEIPNQEVDVNVHPAKAEVRFRDNQAVRSLIVGAIRNALNDVGFRASSTVSASALERFSTHSKSASGYSNINNNVNSPLNRFYQPLEKAMDIPILEESSGGGFNNHPPVVEPFIPSEMMPPLARYDEIYKEIEKSEEQNKYDSNSVGMQDYTSYPLGAARCQLHKTYIVAQTDDGIVIVDQHAAHERLVLEKMKLSINKNNISRQKLLIPEIVTLSEDVVEALIMRQGELLEFGFVIEKFGDETIIVRETPAMLGEVNVQDMVRELADNISEYGQTLALKEKIEQLSGTIACHGSIRAGRMLNIAEMNDLLRQMEQTPLSGQCNHGRPTYIELKLKDIEILFGRR